MNIALIYAETLESDHLYVLSAERLNTIEKSLLRHGNQVTRVARNRLSETLDNFDLIVAAGGDGTQLDAALRLQNKPLCAVRLFPEKSVGFHCAIDYSQIEEFMQALDNHTLQTVRVPRLQAIIDGVPLPTPVLNDILVAHPCPARASRYDIQFNGISESHCSSGIWIATQPGSHGAVHSAGAQPLENVEKAVFWVRELASTQAQLKSREFFPGKDEFAIHCLGTSLMLWWDGGLLAVPLQKGQTLTISRHPSPLVKWTL